MRAKELAANQQRDTRNPLPQIAARYDVTLRKLGDLAKGESLQSGICGADAQGKPKLTRRGPKRSTTAAE